MEPARHAARADLEFFGKLPGSSVLRGRPAAMWRASAARRSSPLRIRGNATSDHESEFDNRYPSRKPGKIKVTDRFFYARRDKSQEGLRKWEAQ